MFCAPWQQSTFTYFQPSFPVPFGREVRYRCANYRPGSKHQQGIHRHQIPPRSRNAARCDTMRGHTAHYGQTWRHPWNQKYISTYRNAARGGPSHGHRGSAQKSSWRSVQRFQGYVRGQTDTQTHRQTDRNTPLPYQGGVKNKCLGEYNGHRLYTGHRLDYRLRLWAPTSAISAVAELLVLIIIAKYVRT